MSGPKSLPDKYADFTLEELQQMVDKGELNHTWLDNYRKRRSKIELFGDPNNDAPSSAKPANDLDAAMQLFDKKFVVITDNGKTQVYWTHEDGMTVPYLTLNDFFSA